jgi:hypothetical protein
LFGTTQYLERPKSTYIEPRVASIEEDNAAKDLIFRPVPSNICKSMRILVRVHVVHVKE